MAERTLSFESRPGSHPGELPPVTLVDQLLAYVEIEMDYSRSKDGYSKKLDRFKVPPGDDGSVLFYMGSYWHRFNHFNKLLRTESAEASGNQRHLLAARTLVYLGKTTAGMADKVGFSLWVDNGGEGEHTATALGLIRLAIRDRIERDPDFLYEGWIGEGEDFVDTNMGVCLDAMHRIIRHQTQPGEPAVFYQHRSEMLLSLAIKATVCSLSACQAHVRQLGRLGIRPDMPKPGVPGGEVEPWDSPNAKLWAT